MKYQVQILKNNEWNLFAMADEFCIAWDIVDCQQTKYKFLPNMHFRILEVANGKVSVV
jgi:hypothetical protein